MRLGSFVIGMSDSTTRIDVGSCIYCRAAQYSPARPQPLGEEHVIAEGMGGCLALGLAACEDCESRVNSFEQPIQKTVFHTTRIRTGVRRKRRKRVPDSLQFMATIAGRNTTVELPIDRVPAILFLPILGPPGILVGRPPDQAHFAGGWVKNIVPTDGWTPAIFALQGFASPVIDTKRFVQFLAKIAHCFAVYVAGIDGFKPLLIDLIRDGTEVGRYHLVGGEPEIPAPSASLHELKFTTQDFQGKSYVVVLVRLFANLGSPVYSVCAGISKAA